MPSVATRRWPSPARGVASSVTLSSAAERTRGTAVRWPAPRGGSTSSCSETISACRPGANQLRESSDARRRLVSSTPEMPLIAHQHARVAARQLHLRVVQNEARPVDGRKRAVDVAAVHLDPVRQVLVARVAARRPASASTGRWTAKPACSITFSVPVDGAARFCHCAVDSTVAQDGVPVSLSGKNLPVVQRAAGRLGITQRDVGRAPALRRDRRSGRATSPRRPTAGSPCRPCADAAASPACRSTGSRAAIRRDSRAPRR